MTLDECYQKLGGNYSDVISRLRSERLVHKFVLKFLDDGNFDLLRRSLCEENVDDAFRAAHTIKGMCQNLGFSRLEASVVPLTEALRAGSIPEGRRLFEPVAEDYEITVNAIREYQAAL